MNVDFDQLQSAPELALLAAIDHSLLLARFALVVAHPELVDDGFPSDGLIADEVARQLVDAITNLSKVIARYHAAVAADVHRDIDADIPF